MGKTVKLQGIGGEKDATEVKNLEIGDFIVWNYGYRSEVVEILPSKTAKTVNLLVKGQDGEVRSRRMGVNRLVVVEKPQR